MIITLPFFTLYIKLKYFKLGINALIVPSNAPFNALYNLMNNYKHSYYTL